MKKNKRRKAKKVKPDDYFRAGPIEFARFGKVTVSRSNATPAEFETAQARMAAHYPVAVAEIDALVKSIAEQVARLPSDRLLHRAWWEYAALALGLGGKEAEDSDMLTAARMIDYVQSVIASVMPEPQAEEVSEEDWTKLTTDVSQLFTRLTVEYQICLSAHRKAQDPNFDMELDEFRARAEMLWLNIRGKRYQQHERQALLDVLSPHSDVLTRLFGLDAPALVDELDKVLAKLTRGLGEVGEEMVELQTKVMDRFEALAAAPEAEGKDIDELKKEVFEDPELAAMRDRVTGGFFGLDLFDVAKNTALPKVLLDELSWLPGEDTEFFSEGEFAGWPLRIWPTMKRPFIRLSGVTYCFDVFSLFDNFYRVLRRIVVKLEPEYATLWNERQKIVSEELPFTYLQKLLPGAREYRPVYYRWQTGEGPAQWIEADGILIYADHLLVVEVKGGAFTYTSPANDLPAHLESLRALLQAPARQGNRFVDYLKSAPEVSLADAAHNEIVTIRHADFRHITVCTVTLDAFTALAARAQHLTPLGISVDQRPLWPLSIDDLRVYSELFDNPLTFLHFVEQRVKAGQSKNVDLNDEMDHFGLYVEQNNYTQYAEEATGNVDKMQFTGFTTPIDEYFSQLVRGEQAKIPKQRMPARISELVDFLAQSDSTYRSELASFFLNAAGDFRDTIAAAIDTALRENGELRRARPLSFYGGMEMTLYVWSPDAPRLIDSAKEHTQVVMLANNEKDRRLVELEYSDAGKLVGAHLRHISLEGVEGADLERLKAECQALQNKRIANARLKGKIGRNDQCPCGSGKKYKKCHGAVR